VGVPIVQEFIGCEFENASTRIQYEDQMWRCRKTVLLCG
jgi:hypothetical protein